MPSRDWEVGDTLLIVIYLDEGGRILGWVLVDRRWVSLWLGELMWM